MKRKMTTASLFAGCGGLDLGFQAAGYDIFWANEFNKDASKSYEKIIGHSPITEDIWNIIDEIPHSQIIIGGPPCQSFSLVGKRIEDDERGRLVHAYLETIQRNKPEAFVLENVAGMASSKINNEKLPSFLAAQFNKIGYNTVILKLNAADYFVPQRRVRIFLIGTQSSKEFKMISPEAFSEKLNYPDLKCPVTVSEALDDLPTPLPKGSNELADYKTKPHSSYAELIRGNNDLLSLHSMPTMSEKDRAFVQHIPPGGNYQDIPDAISTIRIMKFKASGGRTTTYGRLDPNKPAYTINTYFNRPNVGAHYHHKQKRLITVREAMRLQSFPDNFTPYFSNQRSLHMQIGNAVPPLLGQAVAESLKENLK